MNERICHFCNSDLGDEYHYLLACSKFNRERKQYLKPYYYKRPNVLKYHEIINSYITQLLVFVIHYSLVSSGEFENAYESQN